MINKVKYIKTERGEIIMFGDIIQHSDFRSKNPISAGFVSFGLDIDGNPTCLCYGESISLNLVSDEHEDTKIARRQFGFNIY